MTAADVTELAALLDEVRRELAETVDELDRSRAAHRRVESVLLAVLEHVPVPFVVLDDDLRVRAASKSAESAWDATLDAHASGVEVLEGGGVADVARTAFEVGHLAAGSAPDGFGMAMIEEPGTGLRYVTAWAG